MIEGPKGKKFVAQPGTQPRIFRFQMTRIRAKETEANQDNNNRPPETIKADAQYRSDSYHQPFCPVKRAVA